jgi:enoyl-CoA hydratase
MVERVSYRCDSGIATVVMDDGKVNALSPAMIADIGAAFERAEHEASVVVLAGRDGVFSAGFDLKTLRGGGPQSAEMLRAGFELAYRMLSFPRPIVGACTGHAIAMGAFLLLSTDLAIGEAGADHTIRANEVAIGLPVPAPAIEICRVKLTPSALHRALVLAEPFNGQSAVAAGFLDALTERGVLGEAHETAARLASLDLGAVAATKLRLRDERLRALRAAIDA